MSPLSAAFAALWVFVAQRLAQAPASDGGEHMAEPASFTPAPTTTITAQEPFSLGPALRPDFDVLEILPESRQDLVRKMRQRRDDARALCVPFEDIQAASMEKIAAANALSRLASHAQDGGFGLKPDDRRVIEAQRTLDKATADFKRLTELQEVRSAAWQAASGALAACEDWLRHGVPGGCALEEVKVEPPTLNKNETVVDAIERHRQRVRELKADLHRIASAPFPSSYSKQRLRQMVEQFAARGTPDVNALVEHDAAIVWPMLRVQSEVIGAAQRALAFHEAVDVVGLLANLLKPAMISFLDTLVDAEKDDAASLSPEARELAASEVQNDLLATERDLAAFVFQAQAQNLPIEHGDINPIALLGLRLVTAPRATPPPSSPERAGYNLIGGQR
jgi:hypothetical protein